MFDAVYFSASEIDMWRVWYSLQSFLMISLYHPQLTVGRCDLLFVSVNFAKSFGLINTQESWVRQYVFAFSFLSRDWAIELPNSEAVVLELLFLKGDGEAWVAEMHVVHL